MTLDTELVSPDEIIGSLGSMGASFSRRTLDANTAIRLFTKGFLVMAMVDIAELRRDGINGSFPMVLFGVEDDGFGKITTVHLLDISGNLGYEAEVKVGFKVFERSLMGTPDNAIVSDSIVWGVKNGKK